VVLFIFFYLFAFQIALPNVLHDFLYLQVVGDGLLMSNPKRIERAIQENACDALLLKVYEDL